MMLKMKGAISGILDRTCVRIKCLISLPGFHSQDGDRTVGNRSYCTVKMAATFDSRGNLFIGNAGTLGTIAGVSLL